MANSINGMAELFRARLARQETIALPGCHDVLSAMMAETPGFGAVFLSGYSAAASAFGNPDIGLTTLSETAALARNMIQRVRAHAGRGQRGQRLRQRGERQPDDREMESAGVAGIVMEDQILPKRCGHAHGKKVLPLEVYLSKLAAALGARRRRPIIARTDSIDRRGGPAGPQVPRDRRRRRHHRRSDQRPVRRRPRGPGNKQVNLIFGGKTPILSATRPTRSASTSSCTRCRPCTSPRTPSGSGCRPRQARDLGDRRRQPPVRRVPAIHREELPRAEVPPVAVAVSRRRP